MNATKQQTTTQDIADTIYTSACRPGGSYSDAPINPGPRQYQYLCWSKGACTEYLDYGYAKGYDAQRDLGKLRAQILASESADAALAILTEFFGD